MRLYTVYDRLAEEGSDIFMAKTDAVAVRSYRALMASLKAGRSDEYRLFCVGEYDQGTMTIVPCHVEVVTEVAPDAERVQ